MYLLDTDTLSNLLDDNRTHPRLRARVRERPREEILISVVSIEELLRGALARINTNRLTQNLPRYYHLLEILLASLGDFRTASYDPAADAAFQDLPDSIRKHHPRDARIAVTAMSLGLTVVTRNTRHFEKVPGLKLEDWT